MIKPPGEARRTARLIEAELVVDARCALGEGPCWDSATETLLWVDITGSRIHRLDGARNLSTVMLDRMVGAVAPRVTGGLLAALSDGFALLDASGGLERHIPVEADMLDNRMNDGKVDRLGRFWAGTLHRDFLPGTGALYRLDPDGEVERVLGGLALANGLDWSPSGEQFYFIDSLTHRIDVFDVDEPAGRLLNKRPFAQLPESAGLPDGLTVDAEGNVWVACWDGSAVRGFDPTGEQRAEVDLPVARVTCCAFGGSELDRLYITTAMGSDPPQDPPAGGLFSANTGTRGQSRLPFAA